MADYENGSHTVYDIKYHFVWLTKYRYKILTGTIAKRLRELLIQGCQARGVTIIEGSVGKDHVHMLISRPTSMAPSKIAQYLKGRSSRLIQDEFLELKKTYWGQHLWARGYFCATVGSVTKETIQNYINNQNSDGVQGQFKVEDEFQSLIFLLLKQEDFSEGFSFDNEFQSHLSACLSERTFQKALALMMSFSPIFSLLEQVSFRKLQSLYGFQPFSNLPALAGSR